MTRRGTLAFLLAVAACTGTNQGASTQTSSVSTPTSTVNTPADRGRLAVLDASGDIVVMRPDGGDRLAVTDDAGTSAIYTQPVWSPDGESLAWGQVTDAGFSVGIWGMATAETATIPTTNLPFYTSWAPDGRSLGILHNGADGVAFGFVDVTSMALETVDEDAPFYFSWSPSGDHVVTHAGADRVELVSRDGDRATLEATGPDYLSPQWTPGGRFHVVDGSLVLETDGGREEIAGLDGLAMFVSNQQGTLVAVQTTAPAAVSVADEEPPRIPGSSVVVIDVETGAIRPVVGELALGFFWAPDGETLLVLTSSGDRVTPTVWSTDGALDEYPPYRPPATMLQDTFPFFPQYAQSVGFWAPDSSAFAYAGESVGGEEGIWVQRLDADEPGLVSDGRWVAWSAGEG